MEIDREACKQLRGIIGDNLAVALEPHLMTVDVGNATYDTTSVTFKVRVSVEGSLSPQAKALAQKIEWLNRQGLQSFDADKVASHQGDDFRLSGFSSRSPKYPFLAMQLRTGREYKFTFMQAKKLWGTEALGYENSEAGKAWSSDRSATT